MMGRPTSRRTVVVLPLGLAVVLTAGDVRANTAVATTRAAD